MSYRDDGDALVARNAALEAENERLREQLDELKNQPEESKALVRKPPEQLAAREKWYVRGFAVLVWVAAIVVSILTGVL